MSTEKELMKLVAYYGKECISAGIAELNSSEDVKRSMADDVRKSHDALTTRLRALLTELEEAREDAARYRHIRMRGSFGETEELISTDQVVYVSIGFRGNNIDAAIDAARKGGA